MSGFFVFIIINKKEKPPTKALCFNQGLSWFFFEGWATKPGFFR
jgi:hypothetical protein